MCVYTYMCVYVCMYIYIYIERERERERECKLLLRELAAAPSIHANKVG